MCGDDWFNQYTLITQSERGVQLHPALGSNQTRPGEAAKNQQSSTHTSTTTNKQYNKFWLIWLGDVCDSGDDYC